MPKATVGTVERRFVVKDNFIDGILNYDSDNAYPQRVMYTIAASGTATSCTNLYAKYIHGRGFKDSDLGKLIVNRTKQSSDKILRKIAKDYSKFKGFALHFNFNGLLEISEINFVPFEHCRLTIPDDAGYVNKIAVYSDWDRKKSRSIEKKKIKFIHVFNPDPAVVLSQIEQAGGIEKYSGQVLWFSDDDKEYPACSCDSVFEDVETDAKIKIFKWRTVTTGFMASHLLIHYGKFEKESDREVFQSKIQAFQGADNSSKILTVEVEDKEQVPELIPFDIVNNDKLFELTESTIKNNIIQNYGQPLILLQIKTAGQLGGSQEMKDAMDFYDSTTAYERALFENVFKIIFASWKDFVPEDTTIVPVSGIKVEAKKQTLASVLGVGGTQSLQTIIADTTMTPEQKINILILVFGIPAAESEAIVKGTPIPEPVI